MQGNWLTPGITQKFSEQIYQPTPRFVDLLKQVHQEVLTVNEQKAMPYESLEEAMKLDFGINYAGLYNVVFSFSDSGFASNEVNYHAANICTPENFTRH